MHRANALENEHFSDYFLHYSERKVLMGGYLNSIGGECVRQGKEKQGILWDWMKSKMESRMLLLHGCAQDSYQSTWTAHRDGIRGARCPGGALWSAVAGDGALWALDYSDTQGVYCTCKMTIDWLSYNKDWPLSRKIQAWDVTTTATSF